MSNPTVIVHKPETKINNFNDLKSLRVGTMHNTIQEKEVDALVPALHEKEHTSFSLFQGLIQNKYDAILNEKYVIGHIAANYPDQKITLLEYSLSGSSNDIVMYAKKGDTELINKLNAGINDIKKSGQFDVIIGKYSTALSDKK